MGRVTNPSFLSVPPLFFHFKVLASAAMVQDGTCDIHEVVHSATYWCFDCEQV